jgi:3-methyladenine DNA glycosylase AlkD
MITGRDEPAEALLSTLLTRIAELPARTTEPVRAVRRDFSARLSRDPAAVVLDLAYRLLDEGGFTNRFVAYELVAHHRAALRSVGPAELERLGRGMDTWEAVDTFASYLAGPAWREGQVGDALVHAWARSPDVWWRRAALVSTVPLNTRARGGRGDAARTLAVCEMLTADREDMVVKALSWALRELAKRDPDAVRTFIDRHRTSLAARVLREVGNKLATGLKNPRREPAEEGEDP